MLVAAIILFVIGAIFGAINLAAILQNRATSRAIASLHGLFVIIALAIVVRDIVGYVGERPLLSMWLFIGAAGLGFILYVMDMRGNPLPKALAMIHPAVAMAALVILIAYVAQYSPGAQFGPPPE